MSEGEMSMGPQPDSEVKQGGVTREEFEALKPGKLIVDERGGDWKVSRVEEEDGKKVIVLENPYHHKLGDKSEDRTNLERFTWFESEDGSMQGIAGIEDNMKASEVGEDSLSPNLNKLGVIIKDSEDYERPLNEPINE